MNNQPRRWIVGITGASGMRYAIRLLDVLTSSIDEVDVVVSEAGLRVLAEEEGIKCSVSSIDAEALLKRNAANCRFHNPRDIGASIASGSMLFEGMVIVPCTVGTLGAVASGISNNLVQRAADVTLKEGRRLILVPRETPLSAIHLENMLKLSRAGATILPAMPGFYQMPESIDDLVDGLVMKILDQMRVENDLAKRWNERVAERKGAAHPVVRPLRREA